MFRMDCDPTFFNSLNMDDNLNNNIGLPQIKDLEIICSDTWIPEVGDIELFSELPESLFEQEEMEKKEPTSPTSPIPASPPASPSPVVEEPVEVKKENAEFDLIKYIIFGEVCSNVDEINGAITNFSLSPQNAELLTPVDEKPAPLFDQHIQVQTLQVEIKPETRPSTSAVTSIQHPAPEDVASIKSLRRRAPKRRYSSDSDFSASSHIVASQRSSKKKRGRPAKELITDLPTINDFSHMPIEHASHLVLRIKNNEASRKSRMKSKSKQTAMEDECDRLHDKQQKLKTKKNRLEGQIETLRRWLLGLN